MQNITQEMIINLELLNELISLRKEKNNSKLDEIKYNKCFMKAIDKFSYIVTIHSNRYKKFSNYEDLKQEGLIGLINALNNFNPVRSKNFFKLANWYIKTRIKRAANKYDIINVPINLAKISALNRIFELPVVIDTRDSPADSFNKEQIVKNMKADFIYLTDFQKSIICLYFGIDDFDFCAKNSINAISKKMHISRLNVKRTLMESYNILSKYCDNNDI